MAHPSDPLGSIKSSPVAEILDLSAHRVRQLAERKRERAKYGRRFQYRHLDYKEWRRQFDAQHLLEVLVRLDNQIPCADADSFRPGGVALTPMEWRVMVSLVAWHMNSASGRIGPATIVSQTGINRGNLSRVLRALGGAGLVVNLAGNSAPNLAPNPILGFWDLARLKALRTVRKGRKPPPWE